MAEELKDIKYFHYRRLLPLKEPPVLFSDQGYVGLTGEGWSDFFVQCKKEFHCERIHYYNVSVHDAEFF